MIHEAFPENFWEILGKFPQIRNIKDLTAVIREIEETGSYKIYPTSYNILVDFERVMRSHIYAEWHASEFINEDTP